MINETSEEERDSGKHTWIKQTYSWKCFKSRMQGVKEDGCGGVWVKPIWVMLGFWESTQLLNNNRTYLQQGIYFGFCRRACILHIYSILPFLRAKVHCVGFYMTFESIQRSAKRLLSSLWFLSEYQTSTCFELSASLIGFFSCISVWVGQHWKRQPYHLSEKIVVTSRPVLPPLESMLFILHVYF